MAALFESKALAASSVLARGRVGLAEGDAAGARHEFEMAARLWQEVGAPYQVAIARVGVGEACRRRETRLKPYWSS